MGNIFGEIFRITTFGESHGGAIGVVVDGCPPNLPLEVAEIQNELDRRRPGQSSITTPRNEADEVIFLSGLYQGKTLGSPIAMLVYNKDARPEAYSEMRDKFRPSHADFTYQTKYGHRNPEGGGRSSARETIGRVAAGAIAKKILSLSNNIEIRAYVDRVYDIQAQPLAHFPSIEEVEKNIIRCPDDAAAAKMIHLIETLRKEGDSVGGSVLCRVKNLPVGLGEPVFDRLEADLAKAMLSIPATKAFEVGSGFAGTHMKGSEHNDAFVMKDGQVRTKTNYSGGIQGGISNGEELYFRVGFKPTATILKKQQTVDSQERETELIGRGRHDPCVLPRAVPIVESMAALVLLDHLMRNSAQCETFDFSLTL